MPRDNDDCDDTGQKNMAVEKKCKAISARIAPIIQRPNWWAAYHTNHVVNEIHGYLTCIELHNSPNKLAQVNANHLL